MAIVLITGGSGLIGTELTARLIKKGYTVTHLSRKPGIKSLVKSYKWDPKNGIIDPAAIEAADHIIHLAGTGIADKRWTERRKKEIIESRTEGAKLLYESIKKVNKKPKIFITASAIGYYGAVTIDKIFKEEDPPAFDFLGQCCKLWEAASAPIEKLGIRRVIIRTSVVLSNKGGALPKMLMPVKYFIGAPLGTGRQWMPWIHIEDLCNIYIKAIEDAEMTGAYNATAPEKINNREFTRSIARTIKKPLWFPNVPAFALKILFGEMSVVLLKGSRVSSEKIINKGFVFRFSNSDKALENLL